jgi:hypothetical protein
MNRILNHVRSNLVGYLALFVALGGTSYAAVSLPAESVGTKQLRNGAVTSKKLARGSITPAKLDTRLLGGSIRYWAQVNQNGQVVSGSRGASASAGGAQYTVSWGTRFPSRCAALVTSAAVPGIAPIADSTGVGINQPTSGKGPTVVYVWTFSNGSPTRAPFYIVVVC